MELLIVSTVIACIFAVLGLAEKIIYGKEESICQCPENIDNSNDLCSACAGDLDAWFDDYLERKV